jgi:hypothetical protein
MKKIKIFFIAMLILFESSAAFCATYYLDGESGLDTNSGEIDYPWKTLDKANETLVAGDTVYIRGGTYYITENGIAPVNNGTDEDNMITFSGYNSEEVIIYGVNDITGRASRGINLYNKSFIKITKLIFSNLATYLYITNGSHHNEISYCTFNNMRDVWNVDVIKTGTHTGATGSSTILVDSNLDGGSNKYAYRGIFNITDGSHSYMSNSSDDTTVTHTSYPLVGGENNYWTNGDEYKITYTISWAGSYIYEGNSPQAAVSHNWIHHNTFHNYGAYSETHDEGVVLELGVGSSTADTDCNYNTIEYNHMYAGGHHVLGVNAGKYNVIRGNYVHNEGWYSNGKCSDTTNGKCGYRVISATVPSSTFGGHSLWENNRVGYGAAYGGPHLMTIGGSGSGTTLATPANIYRYNDHFGNALFGLRLGASISTAGNDNRVYNNTFYYNGYGADDDDLAYDDLRMGISLYNDSCAGISGSVIINNLLYDHWSETNNRTTSTYYPAIWYVSAENLTCNTIENNFYDSIPPYTDSVNPLFQDPDISTPSSTSKPDFSLQNSSPAIDQGTYLTQANNAGASSTILIVDDASFFQDGTWGSDLARSAFYPDWIAIGTISNVVQISSINYSTNTITLASAMTWSDNAQVWLYKKSDGSQVLYDDAPDFGAHEYNGALSNITGVIHGVHH